MFFDDPSDEERLSRQLIKFSEVAEYSFDISRRLIKEGLHLLEFTYGGVLQNAEAPLDVTVERIEVERLKERYGAWTVFRDETLTWFGYRSSFLDELLGAAGVTRDVLDDLSRAEEIDRRIDTAPWALRYRRDALCNQRSEAKREIVDREIKREFDALSLKRPDISSKAGVRISRFVDSKFSELGYAKSENKYEKFKTVYTNEKRVKRGLPIEFAPHIDLTPATELPASLNLYLMPNCDVSGANDFFIRCMQRGDFFKLAGPLAPNFGLYRVACDMEQLEVMLYAYGVFLKEVIPVIEDVLDQTGRRKPGSENEKGVTISPPGSMSTEKGVREH